MSRSSALLATWATAADHRPAAYELPGVPWVSYFTGNGVAFHGTYWHDNFGSPTSHGCLNMRNAGRPMDLPLEHASRHGS